MELTITELVAYKAPHGTFDLPWRCMECEHLTKHADGEILDHLEQEHGVLLKRLVTDTHGDMYRSLPQD